MPKFLKIYVRKVHRWLAIPTIVLIPLMIVTNKTPANLKIQKFLQIFMLALAVTGLYLLILPWWSKWNKKKNNK
ncbi:MAG TPA: hypothetical protein DCG34_07930 [Clostridiales bacterium]|nr:hypothetical protein [Clostridiales bacterium]